MEQILLPLYLDADSLPQAKRGTEIRKTVNGVNYRYTVFTPSRMRPGMPLVIECHGGGGDGNRQIRSTAWAELAEREGFVVVYPSANYPENEEGHINWRCQTPDYEKDCDYIMEIADMLLEEYRLDPGRVYVSGMSFGDYMSTMFAAKYAGRLAGLCGFNGPANPREWREKIHLTDSLPVIQIRGELDLTLPWPGSNSYSAEEAFEIKKEFYIWNRERWLEQNGADPVPLLELDERRNVALYIDRKHNCDLRYVEHPGMGHVEPMSDMEYVWEHCFSRYRRTESGIERIAERAEVDMDCHTIAIAEGCARIYRGGKVERLSTEPRVGRLQAIPEDFWCKISENDVRRAPRLFLPLAALTELFGGTVSEDTWMWEGCRFTFYENTCLVSTKTRHYAMDQPAVRLEENLWVPVENTLRILGIPAAEKDGVILCSKEAGSLTKGFAILIRRLLEQA